MSIRFAGLLVALLVVLALGCAPDNVDRGSTPEERQACVLPTRSLASARDTAVWCAEQFIARNGYTDVAPLSDTSLIAFESLEWANSIEEMLRHRSNTLQRHAFGICEKAPGPHYEGFVVVFRYRDTTQGARGVTMSKRFHGP